MSPMPREPPVTRATFPSMEKRFVIGGTMPRRGEEGKAPVCRRRRLARVLRLAAGPPRPGRAARGWGDVVAGPKGTAPAAGRADISRLVNPLARNPRAW